MQPQPGGLSLNYTTIHSNILSNTSENPAEDIEIKADYWVWLQQHTYTTQTKHTTERIRTGFITQSYLSLIHN